jgi:hypothetical protein
MGLPLPEDPERPDWLVGAEEGVDAESARTRAAHSPPPPVRLVKPASDESQQPERVQPTLPAPTLSRPAPGPGEQPLEFAMDPAGETGPGGVEAPRLVAGQKPRPDAEASKSSKPVAWAAAASSVPTLRGQTEKPAIPSARAAKPQPDMSPAADPRAESHAAIPRLTLASPLEGRLPEEDDPDSHGIGAISADADAPEEAVFAAASRGPRQVVRAAPKESWWMIALDALRGDRRVQVVLAALVVVVVGFFSWPRDLKSLSISEIQKHPVRYDGQPVEVRGRVGEVFALGGGFSYYLHQGRDTIVVFTRGAKPEWRSNILVRGKVSTGFLDGISRPSIFAD